MTSQFDFFSLSHSLYLVETFSIVYVFESLAISIKCKSDCLRGGVGLLPSTDRVSEVCKLYITVGVMSVRSTRTAGEAWHLPCSPQCLLVHGAHASFTLHSKTVPLAADIGRL